MIRIVFAIFCLLCINEKEEVILWSDDYKLSWSDFDASPKTGISAVATTASGITFSYAITENSSRTVGYKTTIEAHFYPKKSWYKSERATNYILSHEQLHFDITELHARKFRFQAKDLDLTDNLKQELDSIHKKIIEALSKMQDVYDAETDFSRIPEQQTKWQKYVTLELKKLDAYKSRE